MDALFNLLSTQERGVVILRNITDVNGGAVPNQGFWAISQNEWDGLNDVSLKAYNFTYWLCLSMVERIMGQAVSEYAVE